MSITKALTLIEHHRPDIAEVLIALPINFGTLPTDAAARYSRAPNPHVIINDDQPIETDSLAASLIHEGLHALEDRLGILPLNGDATIEAEIRGFELQAAFWQTLYPEGKASPTPAAAQCNAWLRLYTNGTLAATVRDVYQNRVHAA